jgi:hypothetical protein
VFDGAVILHAVGQGIFLPCDTICATNLEPHGKEVLCEKKNSDHFAELACVQLSAWMCV